jgi:hypothetical protein
VNIQPHLIATDIDIKLLAAIRELEDVLLSSALLYLVFF